LLPSPRKLEFKNQPIIVVDDGRKPTELNLHGLTGVRVINLPFDVGLSAGRNAGVDACETEYFVTLDDDFIFGKHIHQSLMMMHQAVNERGRDICGGGVVGQPISSGVYRREYVGEKSAIVLHKGHHLKRISEKGLPDIDCCHHILNFFLARTEVVRAVRWTDAIKIGLEHPDFFYRCTLEGYYVGRVWGASIDHEQDRSNRFYAAFRKKRVKRFTPIALKNMKADAYAYRSRSGKIGRIWGDRMDLSNADRSHLITPKWD